MGFALNIVWTRRSIVSRVHSKSRGGEPRAVSQRLHDGMSVVLWAVNAGTLLLQAAKFRKEAEKLRRKAAILERLAVQRTKEAKLIANASASESPTLSEPELGPSRTMDLGHRKAIAASKATHPAVRDALQACGYISLNEMASDTGYDASLLSKILRGLKPLPEALRLKLEERQASVSKDLARGSST